MKTLFIAGVCAGIAMTIVGAFIWIQSGGGDPGTRFAPTLAGWALVLLTAGATVVVALVAIAAWWRPTRTLLKRVQSSQPDALVLVVQLPSTAKSILNRGRRPGDQFGTYAVLAVTSAGLDFWASIEGTPAIVDSRSIRDVETRTVTTGRSMPGIAVITTSPHGSALVFVPCRIGKELFAELDRSVSAKIAGRIRDLVSV